VVVTGLVDAKAGNVDEALQRFALHGFE